jgi:hypothetical protein
MSIFKLKLPQEKKKLLKGINPFAIMTKWVGNKEA